MTDLSSTVASQSAFANTEDEEEQNPLLEARVDDLMQKFEILSQKVQLNEKEKIADVKEHAPLLDHRVDDLISKVENLTRKRDDNEKDKCGDEEDLIALLDPRLNKMMKKIEDLNLEFKEKEDLSKKRERDLVKKAEEFQKEKENLSKTISDLQEQVSSLIRKSPTESPDVVNFGRADENLDALELQMSDQTQYAQDWHKNEIRLIYDIASVFTCLL